MRTKEEVIHAFTPVSPLKAEWSMKLLKIQNQMKDTAMEIIDLVPDSPDRTAALRKLLECKFTCIQAITHQKEIPDGKKEGAQGNETQSPEAQNKNQKK